MTEPDGEPERRTPRDRRLFLSAAVMLGLAWWAWPRVAPLFVGPFDFEEIDNPSGFRRIAGGEITGLPSFLFGLDARDAADLTAEVQAARSDLCQVLFGGTLDPNVVPIAYFSDYNCPYCRVLTERLANVEAQSAGGVQIAWHEWPVFGPTSVLSARAALAADMQGAYIAFHKHLMRSRFVPTERYLANIAQDLGADPERLLADMNSPDVSSRLRNTEAVAQIFGFAGTPSLVVGRTVVIGSVSEATLTALVEQERRDGPPPACSA